MRRLFTFARCLIMLAIVFALGVAVLASLSRDSGRSAGDALSRATVHGHITQLETEYARFLADFARFAMGDQNVNREDVGRRLDAIWSRSSILANGPGRELAANADSGIGAIPILMSRLRAHEADLLTLDRQQVDANRRLIDDFAPLQEYLRKLSLRSLELREEWRDGVRASVGIGAVYSNSVFLGSLLVSVVLTALLVVDGYRDRRLRRERRKLRREARAADTARSRFLSMMSHELRTPMNGVLGLLQLLRQSKLSESQFRLVDQAERSGRQMTDLLSDILEFSELQAERLEITVDAYQPRDLAAAIEALLAAPATRNRTAVTVECAKGTPEWILGDFARLRQALTHIAANIVGDERVRTIRLNLSHDVGRLVCSFVIETFTRGGAGSGSEPQPGTEPDSLGLAIAHGLIRIMGGEVRVAEPEPGTHELDVIVPGAIVYPKRDSVRIVEKSETSALLLRGIVEEAGLRVWSQGLSAAQVDAVLLELPVNDEAATVAKLRSAHPGARIIAVGSPRDGSAFDGMCSGATDHRALTAALVNLGGAARAG